MYWKVQYLPFVPRDDITGADGKVILEADTVIEELATDKEGKLTFTADLPIGFAYYIKETSPSSGFATTDETQEFTFEYEGAEKEKVFYSFTFEDEPTVIEITKRYYRKSFKGGGGGNPSGSEVALLTLQPQGSGSPPHLPWKRWKLAWDGVLRHRPGTAKRAGPGAIPMILRTNRKSPSANKGGRDQSHCSYHDKDYM